MSFDDLLDVDSLEELFLQNVEGLRPSVRMTVDQAAEKYRYIRNNNSYIGPWKNSKTPYLIEPMREFTNRLYQGVVFAGPAQCGKTDMFLNYIGHTAKNDPADMMLVQTSMVTARDFSKRRIDRLHRHSPLIGERLLPDKSKDNTFDKNYKDGWILSLSWPAINELSGKPIPRVWLTDYDRMPQDIDNEGSPFDLARGRTRSFKTYGKTIAESSPGFSITNHKWVKKTPHEAPPTEGILSLYNRGDRRRYYWKCVGCGNSFQPHFSLLSYPKSEDFMESAEQAVMSCPVCGIVYNHDSSSEGPGKAEMNQTARWIKDGMIWREDGEVVGNPYRSDIASFWLFGVCAAFSTWRDLVIKYLTAQKEYEDTGAEFALKSTVNIDQGDVFIPKSFDSTRLPEELKGRSKDYGMRRVPRGVRFLIATIDVQKRRFEVQITGVGYGGEMWVIDTFPIIASERPDPDVPGNMEWISPGSYPEDWNLIVTHVMLKSYELGDGSGRCMSIKHTFCDSGGEAGVTTNAYAFYRWLLRGPKGEEPNDNWQPDLVDRFRLVKGDPSPNKPRQRMERPDSQRKDRLADARGEIPILFLNSNAVKDQADNILGRTEQGGPRLNFPDWLPDSYYVQLTVEVKINGKWDNPKNFRNEAWDHLCYTLAGCWSERIGMERRDFWEDPPIWAAEWDINAMVFDPNKSSRAMEGELRGTNDLSALAKLLA